MFSLFRKIFKNCRIFKSAPDEKFIYKYTSYKRKPLFKKKNYKTTDSLATAGLKITADFINIHENNGSTFLKKLSRKFISVLSLCLAVLMFASSCTSVLPPAVSLTDIKYPAEGQHKYAVRAAADEKELLLSILSWQFGSVQDARDYARKIKELGFTGVEFCVVWDDIEPEKGVFDWTFFDAVMNVFTEHDLSISLSLFLWPLNLSWNSELDFQITADGDIFEYDEVRGPMLSYNSERNIETIRNTMEHFAAHCTEKFSSNIISWSVRTDCFGQLEYPPVTELDYSESERNAFFNFLENIYPDIKDFNDLYSTYNFTFLAWDEIREYNFQELVKICKYEWNVFKQESVLRLTKLSCDIFKAADTDMKIALRIGSYWDTAAAVFRGVFDPFKISELSGADIIHINADADSSSNRFYLDMTESLTGMDIKTEFDWVDGSETKNYNMLIALAGISGVQYVNISNQTLESIDKNFDSISKYRTSFIESSSGERKEADSKSVILINTLDFLLRKPPYDLYEIHKSDYNRLSGSENKKVRFITDTQLKENPAVLENVENIYLGRCGAVTSLDSTVAEIIADSGCRIYIQSDTVPVFVNQHRISLNSNIIEKIKINIQ